MHPAQARAFREGDESLVKGDVRIADRMAVGRNRHRLDDRHQGGAGRLGVAEMDLLGGRALDGLSSDVHVADPFRSDLDDEQAAVPDGDEQPLGGQALQPLPQRPAAHAQLARQLGLAQLGAGGDVALAMASRTRLAIMLAVDSWTTGSNGRRGGAAGVRLDGLLAMRGQPLLGVRNKVPSVS